MDAAKIAICKIQSDGYLAMANAAQNLADAETDFATKAYFTYMAMEYRHKADLKYQKKNMYNTYYHESKAATAKRQRAIEKLQAELELDAMLDAGDPQVVDFPET